MKTNWFRKRKNSMKAETAHLCGLAEQHNFCDNCGLLLCEGDLCGPPENYDELVKTGKEDEDES